MKNKLLKHRQVDVVLRVPSGLPGVWGSCLIHLHPKPDTRVVATETGSVRIAFSAAEIRLIAGAVRRVHPRLLFKLPAMDTSQNKDYIPGRNNRPFLVVLTADDAVKIGIELADGVPHPVVELTAAPNSRVRRTSSGWTWMPRWTEVRVLVAEYAPVPSLASAGRSTPQRTHTK